jgi:hypothetical protein
MTNVDRDLAGIFAIYGMMRRSDSDGARHHRIPDARLRSFLAVGRQQA